MQASLRTIVFRVDQDLTLLQKVYFRVNPLGLFCDVGGFSIIVFAFCWLLSTHFNKFMLKKKLVEAMYTYHPTPLHYDEDNAGVAGGKDLEKASEPHIATLRAKEVKFREYGKTPSAKLRCEFLYDKDKSIE